VLVRQQPSEPKDRPRWFRSLISSGYDGSIPSQMRRKEKSVGSQITLDFLEVLAD
jgi:hypothetical protein